MRVFLILGMAVMMSLGVAFACGGDDDTGCTPNCAGRECGWDPVCGTQSCGTCPTDRPNCNAATGLCSGGTCTPNCAGRECGMDPVCGTQSCGTCPTDRPNCSAASGVCSGTTCTPDCGGRECGMDPVCGTLPCGSCGTGETCSASGTCTPTSDPCASYWTCETCSPIGGCGWCETTWTCMSGTAWGPSTGSCASWRFNPSECGDDCTPCVRDTDCPAGGSCLRRYCDGAAACYATGSSLCPLVGGEPCPEVSAYEICSSSDQCGPYADCLRFADGSTFCMRRCSVDADCPPVRTDLYPSLSARCNTAGGSNHCYLECPGPGTCPTGLSCFRYETGDYGYCG
jgi:hypothetical protein